MGGWLVLLLARAVRVGVAILLGMTVVVKVSCGWVVSTAGCASDEGGSGDSAGYDGGGISELWVGS
jgi:hypothetical protein